MFVKISFLLCICFSALYSAQGQLKLTLYYEALCPYSEEFIKEQLAPTYAELGSNFTVELVPYGKSKHREVHGKWKTTCHHGPKECYANRVQSCVLGEDNTQEAAVNFVLCIMSTDKPENKQNNKKCARKNKLSWDDIKMCVNGPKGDEMVSHFGNITSNLVPKLSYVPHILFDDVADEKVEDDARNDLRTVVCEKLQPKPSACASDL